MSDSKELKSDELEKVSGGNENEPLGTFRAGDCYNQFVPGTTNNVGNFIFKIKEDTPYYSLDQTIPCKKYWPTVVGVFGGPVDDNPTAGFLLTLELYPKEMTNIFN